MLKVTVGTSMNRKDMLLPENTTLADAIAVSEITPTSNESFTLNGTPLKRSNGDLDRTFADYGLTNRAVLLSVKNSQNA